MLELLWEVKGAYSMRAMVIPCGAGNFHFMFGEYESLHMIWSLTREQ